MTILFFSKTLLNGLDDPEQSSAIGAAIILKNFVQYKGAEMFHAVPELVKESLNVRPGGVQIPYRIYFRITSF